MPDFDQAVKELESAVAVALGEQENGTARLEDAIAAHRAALEEYTRDRAPLQTGNRGIAFMPIADPLGDATKAQSAIQEIEVAFVAIREGGNAAARRRILRSKIAKSPRTSRPADQQLNDCGLIKDWRACSSLLAGGATLAGRPLRIYRSR